VPTREAAPTPTDFPTIAPQVTEVLIPNPSQPPGPPHFQNGQEIKIEEVHMATRDQGWGISGPYVLTTDDGGGHWREVTPPHPGLSASDTQAFGAFEGGNVGWVVFSDSGRFAPDLVIWHTLDSGSHWTPSYPFYQEIYGDEVWAELRAGDAAHAWMALRGVYFGAGAHYVAQLFRTTDAGVSWEALAADTDLNWSFTGMEFADDQAGWLTWETLDPYDDGPPNYAFTSDGGLTWETCELPAPLASPTVFEDNIHSEPYAPTFLSPTSMRVLVGSYDFSPPPPGAPLPPEPHSSYLYASDDAGTTWLVRDLPEAVFAPNYGLVFFDAETALLLGREIFQTSDGGRSWGHVKTVFWDGQFSFVDPSYGWAVATSGEKTALVRTFDGGRTWEEVEAKVTR
jgi:photosystem II stability/assembly factor-like uncharacterized protein